MRPALEAAAYPRARDSPHRKRSWPDPRVHNGLTNLDRVRGLLGEVAATAYITPIGGDPAQVEYRLGASGCAGPQAADRQFSRRPKGRERPLRWIGKALADLGIEAGSELPPEQFDLARRLMRGQHPHTGQQLVAPKLAIPEDAKVAVSPLVRAIHGVAHEAQVSVAEVLGNQPKLLAAFQAAERAVARKGDAARLRADEAGVLADAAGLNVDQVWGVDVYATAAANLFETRMVRRADGTLVEQRVPRRVVVGNAGYDVTLTLPKSYSVLLAFAAEQTADIVEGIYDEKVEQAFAWLEDITAYGMRGKHGNGHTAQTVKGNGFAGWVMVHRTARPVHDGHVGDPHWHAHVTLANMTRGPDGKWSTVAAGGRDLMRHAAAVDHVLKALVRNELSRRYGIRFERNPRTGAWEIAGIPDATLRLFSKRHADIKDMLTQLGYDEQTASRVHERIAEQRSRRPKNTAIPTAATLQQVWQAEERAAGRDPASHLRRVFHGGTDPDSRDPAAASAASAGPVTAADIARVLLDPDRGLTAHSRRFTRADALWRVADAMPDGFDSPQAIEEMTDAVLANAGFVELPTYTRGVDGPDGEQRLDAEHMRNARAYTTADVVDVETVILRAARASHPEQSPVRVTDDDLIQLALSTVEAQQRYPLSAEQLATLTRLVRTGRMIDTVNGAPGTGKTTLMRAVRVVFEAAGYVVAGAATAAVAAHNLHTESGITAHSVAHYVTRLRDGDPDALRGIDVLIVDEANLTNDRDRAVLYQAADATGTRIIEIGDHRQLRGVGVGSLFARVHEIVAGAQLTDNRRQTDEDEREAIAAWRDGRYAEALSIWMGNARLVAAHTGREATAAMLARWREQRAGAPDPHTEIRGLVMLAATNDQVRRLNTAAQALRLADGELGGGWTYHVAGGERLRLHVGDHVLLRVNDRQNLHVVGPPVLNGYRAVVTDIDARGTLTVAWQHPGGDGIQTHTAQLSPTYVAIGGVDLGYAMTIHKSEGLTVGDQWTTPDGDQAGATVLVHAAGADNPALHVATTRHTRQVVLFAGRDELETAQDTHLRGVPGSYAELLDRIVEKLAEHARATETHGDDRPVVVDLGIEEFLTEDSRAHTARAAQEAARAETERTGADAAQRRAERQQARRQRLEADRRRRDAAALLLREVWRHEPRLVEAIIAATAFATLARNLHDAAEAGYDLRELLAEIPLDAVGSNRVRDPAAFTAAMVDVAAERIRTGQADRDAERRAARQRWEQMRGQAVDVIRDAWAARPALAETVIAAPAFDALVRGLDRYADAGLDARDLLAAMPLPKIDAPRVRDKGAFSVYVLHRVAQRQLDAIEQARQEAHQQAERLARQQDAAAVLRQAWIDAPNLADQVIRGPAFRYLADRIDAAQQAGHDVAAVLRELDTDALGAPHVRNPSGAVTFAFTRAIDHAPPPPATPAAEPTMDRQAGDELDQTPTAEPPTPVDTTLAPRPWDQRPHGALTDPQLHQLIAREQQQIERLAAERDAAQQRAEQLDGEVAAGRGPAVREVEDNLARLRELTAAVQQARELDAQWHAADQRLGQAAEQRGQLEYERDTLGRLARGRRADLEARIDQLHTAEQQAQRQARELAQRLAALQQTIGPPEQYRHLEIRARAAEADYPHARRAAEQRDLEAAAGAHRHAARLAEQHQQHTDQLADAVAEQHLRTQLPDPVRQLEDDERAAAVEPTPATVGGHEAAAGAPATPHLTAPQPPASEPVSPGEPAPGIDMPPPQPDEPEL